MDAPHSSRVTRLYETGKWFAVDSANNPRFDEAWLQNYAAYLFYRSVTLIGSTASIVFVLVIRALGLNEWMTLEIARSKESGHPAV
jgi:hypothetical protein